MTPFGWPVVPEEYTRKAKSLSGLSFVLRYRVAPEGFRIEVKCLNFMATSLSSPMRTIRSSGSPTFLAASRATFRNDFCVTKALAPASFN